MNKRIATAILTGAAALSLSALSGCTTQEATAPASKTGAPPETGELTEPEELTEYYETGSEFLLQDIEIVEATETPVE